ncbi:peptide deformylase [Rubrivivax gelatinosus]|uniref:Peptide deformylase n=1 Tax=Rubrivivax gelatinosus TaxID=28068 RepID=A0ABS1DU57_RUBGE|nr:peptide deformylase [Rubrivivax gelatinosus]MBK1612922.1 peptide deformylase [Rubrivivax gelatinosus]MBK1713577.1 peptide deformylase [Rubrivivax gelatinosus]
MAQLPILRYPDPRLNTVARPVAAVDERVKQLVADMIDTMYECEGVGLAATQVDVHERLFVMDTSPEHDQPMVFINPQIVARSAEKVIWEEGCLSVPQVWDRVTRNAQVTVRALDREGQAFELDLDGLAAVCAQHEIDHLDGKVFVEYLSLLKRERIKIKMAKRAREEARGVA